MNKLRAWPFYAAFACLHAAPVFAADEPGAVLTSAADVLALSAEQASSGIKISIKGVVTAAEPDWGGRFFVQDSSGGVFVESISSVQPSPGDVVAVSGVSFPGGYAPIISKPHWEKVGTAPLPAAKAMPIEQLMSGAEDGQRIEISGVVRRAHTNDTRLELELMSGGYRVHVFGSDAPAIDPPTLVGAKVRVTGTAAASYNAPLRRFVATAVYLPFPSDCVVEKPAAADPFEQPLTPVGGVAQFRVGRSFGDRVHVKGVVTCQRKGEDVFIRDATGGLQIQSVQTTQLTPGEVIEAVGFPGLADYLPVLEDAVFRKTPETRTNVFPKNVEVAEIMQGLHHADFVTLTGKLLDRLNKPADAPSAVKTVMVLQTTNLLFTAETDAADLSSPLASIPIGSVVEVSGICFLQSEENGKIRSFQVLLPTSDSVRILARPSWLTARHLLAILAVAILVIIVGSSWTAMVLKNREELQKAHDTLEWRVKERTKQLKVLVTARKEAEVQFKAVLAERTRLAKELHDTLEQMLTGIALQLNTVAKLFRQDPETASHHLGLVRNMVRMSQGDLRRSIWNLRSRELETFDLSKALLVSGNRIADTAGIRVDLDTKGQVRPLPEVVEENLLRIGQEAITNAVKHSDANHVQIQLEFGAQDLVLEIKDDGKGFTPDNCPGPNDGHFGLLGMSERARRFGGQVLVTSAPGNGTSVRVQFPLTQMPLPKPATEEAEYEENTLDPNPGS